MEKQAVLKITGLVQGVFFRDHARRKALELGIKGWVRNEKDGTVSVLAQGNAAGLDEFIEWCKKGPDSAKVENVEIVWESPTGIPPGFNIAHY